MTSQLNHIFITGPQGSGKTTFINNILNDPNEHRKNLVFDNATQSTLDNLVPLLALAESGGARVIIASQFELEHLPETFSKVTLL